MAKGGRTDLSSLVTATGEYSVVDGVKAATKTVANGAATHPVPTELPLDQLVANPRNPRQAMNVEDLASIAEIQLQPALVVTRRAYLAVWPEDQHLLGDATHIVINGCRRLRAAATYGRPHLEVVVKDEVAVTKASLRAAAIRENVERENLDVIEEARAVEDLVADCGGVAKDAAKALGKTDAWVSQRRALLKLVPELQDKLRAGELAVRDARNLGRVPSQDQVARWQEQFDKRTKDKDPEPKEKPAPPKQSAVAITKTLKRWNADTSTLASALVNHYDKAGAAQLIGELQRLTGAN